MPTITSGGPSNAWEPTPEPTPDAQAAPEPDGQPAETAVEAPEPVAATPTASEVRAWAKDNNIPVNDRGAVPASLVEQYQAQTGGADK